MGIKVRASSGCQVYGRMVKAHWTHFGIVERCRATTVGTKGDKGLGISCWDSHERHGWRVHCRNSGLGKGRASSGVPWVLRGWRIGENGVHTLEGTAPSSERKFQASDVKAKGRCCVLGEPVGGPNSTGSTCPRERWQRGVVGRAGEGRGSAVQVGPQRREAGGKKGRG